MKKYLVSLKLEANPIIEAESEEDAIAKGWKMLNALPSITQGEWEYVPQEPIVLENVEDDDEEVE